MRMLSLKILAIFAAAISSANAQVPPVFKTVDQLSSASVLTGSEYIPIYQGANPLVKTTPVAIQTYLESLNNVWTGANVFSNSVTLSGSGTSLSVTNNTLMSGKLTVDGAVLIGTGTLGITGPYGFQTAFNADPSTIGGNARYNIFNTTLSYSGNTTNIWENLNSFLAVNGPGIANGEINLAHTYLQVNAGGNTQVVENYESSVLNNGIIGSHAGYLSIFQNGNSGFVSSIAPFYTYLTNNNTTSGSIGEWDALSIGPMQGGGSYPTFYNAMRVSDSKAGIVTLGGIRIGNLSNAVPGQLAVNGPDNSSGTFPFTVSNLAGNVFAFDDGGNANFQSAGAVIGPSTGGILSINAPDNTVGHFSMNIRNAASTILFNLDNTGIANFGAAGITISPSTGGILSMNAPDNTTGHYALSIKNLAGTNLLSVDDSGIIAVGTTSGVSCTGTPTSSFVSVNGVVTHC